MSSSNLPIFVVGGAGFIGSHLVDYLVSQGERVTVYDNLSVGRREFLAEAGRSGRVELIEADALDLCRLSQAMQGHQRVVHLSANPEARHALARPEVDLEQGTVATHNVLSAMRASGADQLVFASSGTVYGDRADPVGEEDLGQLPISLYGASKFACEAMISAFCSCFELTATIVRFGNVVGPRSTHGVILDLLRKLRATPQKLEVLGDGRQAKPYLHVEDCVRGLWFSASRSNRQAALEIFNLCPDETTRVSRIAELCVQASPDESAVIHYGTEARGWPGDIPRSSMRPDKLRAAGFSVSHSSEEAVARAVTEIAREVFGP